MGALINRITLHKAEVTKSGAASCHIEADWDIAKSSGSYTDSYYINIISDGRQYAQQEITNSGVGDTDTYGAIDFAVAEHDTSSYYLEVTDATANIKSTPQLLVLDTYTGVSASFDGSELYVTWDKPTGYVGAGICTMISSEETVTCKDIVTNTRHLSFLQDPVDYDSNNIWTLVLNPTMGQGIVLGPESPSMCIYTEVPIIQEILLKQGSLQQGNAALIVSFVQSYGTSADLSVLCRIYHLGIELTNYTASMAMPAAVNGVYSIDFLVPEDAVNPDAIADYDIKLNLCTSNASSLQESAQNVRNLANTQIFRRGFYPVLQGNTVQGLVYRMEAPQETSLQVSYTQELFKIPITTAIECGALKLEKKDSGYLLTLQTQSPLVRTDYISFCTQLTTNQVTIRGLYLLQDGIARGCNIPLPDLLYYHTGIDPANRLADLRPGFSLEVETASYIPSYEINKADAAPGFVSTHTARYQISTSEDNGDIRLEFNSFLDQYASYFNVESDENVVLAGGVLDLFVSGYRQPMYRIIYPQDFLASDQEQTHYPTDNVLMIGAASYSQLADYTSSIQNLPTLHDNRNIPTLMFRGRSVLTLMLTVWVNGMSTQVPVGTTFGKLIEMLGSYDKDCMKLSVKRLSPYGYAQLWNSACAKELPLMLGDRIEVN